MSLRDKVKNEISYNKLQPIVLELNETLKNQEKLMVK